MTKNVGNVDRAIRIVAGLAILGAGYFYGSPWGLVGIVPLATGFIRWCPAYIPFGFTSCKKD